MQFVDEQNRVLGTTNFVHHGLDTFFELAAILRARNHHREVKHDDSTVCQNVWHGIVDNHLSKAFDDCRLTNPGFSEKNRIVLLASAQDLDDSFNFTFSTDDRVEFFLLSQFGQVTTKAVQSWSLAAACTLGCRSGTSCCSATATFF